MNGPLFLQNLSEFWRAAAVLGAAIIFGMTVVFVLSGYTSLPEAVERVEEVQRGQEVRVQGLESRWSSLEEKVDRVICLLTLPETARISDGIRECGG